MNDKSKDSYNATVAQNITARLAYKEGVTIEKIREAAHELLAGKGFYPPEPLYLGHLAAITFPVPAAVMAMRSSMPEPDYSLPNVIKTNIKLVLDREASSEEKEEVLEAFISAITEHNLAARDEALRIVHRIRWPEVNNTVESSYTPSLGISNSKLAKIMAQTTEQIIAAGEGEYIEFKEQIFGPQRKVSSSDEAQSIVQEVLGFINRAGGVILLGVSDEREVVGINVDFEQANPNKCNKDGYDCALRQKLSSRIGFDFYTIKYETVQDKEVCRIEVKPSNTEPVFLDKTHLYVREGTMCQRLNGEYEFAYILKHWPNYHRR